MSASIAAAAALSEESSVLFEQLETLLDSEVVQYSTKDYLSDVVAATTTTATTLLLHKTTSQPRKSTSSTSTSTNTFSTFSAPFGVVHTNDNNNCKYDGEEATMFVDEDKENVYPTPTTTSSSLPASTPTFSFPSNSSATTPTPTGSMLAVAAAARTCSRKDWKRKQKAVNWRARVCEWFYQVVDHFEMDRDLACIALNYVDRFCCSVAGEPLTVVKPTSQQHATTTIGNVLQDKRYYQLLAMASLCLTIKTHDHNWATTTSSSVSSSALALASASASLRRPQPSPPSKEAVLMNLMLQLGRENQYTVQQLEGMERHVLQRLQWQLSPPTPQLFITYYLQLFYCSSSVPPPRTKNTNSTSHRNDDAAAATIRCIEELAIFILELSVHDYYFIHFTPSMIAFAALDYATEMLLQVDTNKDKNTSSSFSPVWLQDLQRYLQQHYHRTNQQHKNGGGDDDDDDDNYGYKIDICKGRLAQLYASTGTNFDDFMGVDPNHHLPLSPAAALEAHQSTATRNNSIQQYYTDVDENVVLMDVVG